MSRKRKQPKRPARKRSEAVPEEILAEGSGPVATADGPVIEVLEVSADAMEAEVAPIDDVVESAVTIEIPTDDVDAGELIADDLAAAAEAAGVTAADVHDLEALVDEAIEGAEGEVLQAGDAVTFGAADGAEGAESLEVADDVAPEVAAALPTSAASMDGLQLKLLVEALVFASDKPMTVARLRQLTRVGDVKRLEQALVELTEDHRDRGIVLTQVSGGFQFRTRTQFSAWVQQLIAGRPVRLSRAQLETLAIIAYRQPITRPEIDEIRGVDSSGTLKVLIDRALIRILGKKEEVGRPMLYGTTKEFLDFFSLGDLRELPTLREYSELTDESRRVISDRLGLAPDETPGGGDGQGGDGDGNDGGGSDGGSGGDGGGPNDDTSVPEDDVVDQDHLQAAPEDLLSPDDDLVVPDGDLAAASASFDALATETPIADEVVDAMSSGDVASMSTDDPGDEPALTADDVGNESASVGSVVVEDVLAADDVAGELIADDGARELMSADDAGDGLVLSADVAEEPALTAHDVGGEPKSAGDVADMAADDVGGEATAADDVGREAVADDVADGIVLAADDVANGPMRSADDVADEATMADDAGDERISVDDVEDEPVLTADDVVGEPMMASELASASAVEDSASDEPKELSARSVETDDVRAVPLAEGSGRIVERAAGLEVPWPNAEPDDEDGNLMNASASALPELVELADLPADDGGGSAVE